MKIGIYVTAMFSKPEFKDAISGHVQIPFMTSKILLEAGHQVTIITTKPTDDCVLPDLFPKGASLKLVRHASRQWPASGVYPFKMIRLFVQLLSILRGESFDIVHFFGYNGTGLILGCLKRLGIKSQMYYTPLNPLKSWNLFGRERVAILRPGVIKDLYGNSYREAERNSILFWRNAGYENGADLAIEAFQKLALKYPDVNFVFAVRPNDVLEGNLLELEKQADNIDVHIYPYKNGVTLAKLLRDALFVVQPFRKLSINPQMSILETLYAGVPIITTNIESNAELVKHGQTGLLIPPDNMDALNNAIETLLNNRDLLKKMTNHTYLLTRSNWNWESFKKELSTLYE
jgi:glycosyltransferase involved in cell wall biosynthesis